MRLYLLRHAEAEDHAATDAARELTPKGLEQARTVGAFCQRHTLRPDLILTSPFRRTVQTGETVAEALQQPMATAPFVASGMTPEIALAELLAYQRFASVMLVGHQPDLGELAASLLGLCGGDALPVGKASLICLRVNRLAPGGASLRFFLSIKLMG